MTATETKLAKLNTLEAAIRDWQRGAITARARDFRLGEILNADEIALLTSKISSRTMSRESIAKAIADVLAL